MSMRRPSLIAACLLSFVRAGDAFTFIPPVHSSLPQRQRQQRHPLQPDSPTAQLVVKLDRLPAAAACRGWQPLFSGEGGGRGEDEGEEEPSTEEGKEVPAWPPVDDFDYSTVETDTYEVQDEESMFGDDEEMLQEYRMSKILINDRWQFNMFENKHGGEWMGRWEEFIVSGLEGGGDGPGTGSQAPSMFEANAEASAAIKLIKVLSPSRTFTARTTVTGSEDDRPPEAHDKELKRMLVTSQEVLGSEDSSEGRGGSGDSPSLSSLFPPALHSSLYPDSFRPALGTQVVGNAYTMTSVSEAGSMWTELALRDEDTRIRCLFHYRPTGTGKVTGSTSSSVDDAKINIENINTMPTTGQQMAETAVAWDMQLDRVLIGREKLSELPSPEEEATLFGVPGKGIYDIPPECLSSEGSKDSKEGEVSSSSSSSSSGTEYQQQYHSLYAAGGLTLSFPLSLAADGRAALSMDWSAGKMRFQADRKTRRNDGGVQSLELTEVLVDDVDKYGDFKVPFEE